MNKKIRPLKCHVWQQLWFFYRTRLAPSFKWTETVNYQVHTQVYIVSHLFDSDTALPESIYSHAAVFASDEYHVIALTKPDFAYMCKFAMASNTMVKDYMP